MYAEKTCAKCKNLFRPNSSRTKVCDGCLIRPCEHCKNPFENRNLAIRFCSLACRSKSRFSGVWIYVPCSNCGKEIRRTPKGIRGIRVFCCNRCRALYFWKTPEIRDKILNSLKSSHYVTSGKINENVRRAGLMRGDFTEVTRAKLRAARLKRKFPTRMTSIERALHGRFVALGLDFEMHRSMFGRWQPDFVFDEARLVVQADGEYWHRLPEVVERDRRFDMTAEENGWRVIRFSEAKINSDPDSCVDIVVKHLALPADRTKAVVRQLALF